MRKIMIASHGKLASGLHNTLALFLGELPEVTIVSAFVTEEDFTVPMQAFIQSVADSDEAIIFTDIKGGSVNQKAVELTYGKKNFFIISNVNLPTIVSVLVNQELLTETLIQQMIAESNVCYLAATNKNQNDEEEEFL